MASRTLARRTGLIIDATGGGIPIAQEMRRQRLRPVPITITGGALASGNNVPKRELVSRLLLFLQQRQLKIPPDIKLRQELVDEFNSFVVKFKENGNATYSAAAGAHDDLIMALALACHFFATRRRMPLVQVTFLGRRSGTDGELYFQRLLEDRMLRG